MGHTPLGFLIGLMRRNKQFEFLSSTSHCFEDYNHVDCCTMVPETAQRTNEESKVVGMHRTNFLGSHIVDGSVKSLGTGGSWYEILPNIPLKFH